MKKLLVLVCMLMLGLTQAQEVTPKYEKEGNLVKATFFYKDGSVKQQGYFKNKIPSGTWVSFNEKGIKTAIASYKNGKKVGKWFIADKNGVKEVTYANNKIVNVASTDVALK